MHVRGGTEESRPHKAGGHSVLELSGRCLFLPLLRAEPSPRLCGACSPAHGKAQGALDAERRDCCAGQVLWEQRGALAGGGARPQHSDGWRECVVGKKHPRKVGRGHALQWARGPDNCVAGRACTPAMAISLLGQPGTTLGRVVLLCV